MMDAHTLFTYRNIEELRKIQAETEVFPFAFVETKAMIDACPEVCNQRNPATSEC